jgi:large subunit ribosomal protein L25
MENLKLESEIRTGMGKGVARKLRVDGLVPAVIYGRKQEPVSLAIEEAAIRTILHKHSESPVIDLIIKGSDSDEPVIVIIRDIQRHPATGKLLHVDFQRIKYGEKIRVQVPTVVTGTPKGVKEQGGILEHGIRSIQVMCLPRKIPESVEIDVSDLMIGDAVKLKDVLGAYPDMDVMDDPETTVAHVIPPIVEAVAAEEEAAEEAVEEEPELVAKDKEAEAAPGPGGGAKEKESA